MRVIVIGCGAAGAAAAIAAARAGHRVTVLDRNRKPLKKVGGYRYQHDVKDLLRALEMISERSQRQLPPPTQNFKGIVGKEPYPVARKSGEVLRQLLLRGVERLKSLFRGNKTRSEVVATFLAILELCKTNAITLEDDTSGENPNVRLLEKQPIVEGEMS